MSSQCVQSPKTIVETSLLQTWRISVVEPVGLQSVYACEAWARTVDGILSEIPFYAIAGSF
eukprot:566688-Amphidinium_carterae.1